MSGQDVIVVGAGLAGLAAADALTRAGAAVRVLEARDRVGGRALSLTVPGGVLDAGATWFWPNEPMIGALAERLGVPTFPQHLEGDALFDRCDGDVVRLAGNPMDTPSHRFRGGAGHLAAALASTLAAGMVQLQTPVTAITVSPRGVEVRSRHGTWEADRLVLAVPPALVVQRIDITPALPEPLRRRAQQTPVWMGDMVKAVAVFDRPFWRGQGLSGSAMSHAGVFREFHDHSGPDGTPAAIFGFAPTSTAVTGGTDRLAEVFRAQLLRLFGRPARSPRAVHVTDWSREMFTLPRGPQPAPDRRFGAPELLRPLHDRVWWATTETATDFAGHLEGAVRAGIAAARSVEHAALS
ncbi:MAG TPA: FAD-dependent oxidoreductase [Actinomycetaceae bacterium]|nr:FAD-dependent oxidoreductase [Actinomycetaceae bacterium]